MTLATRHSRGLGRGSGGPALLYQCANHAAPTAGHATGPCNWLPVPTRQGRGRVAEKRSHWEVVLATHASSSLPTKRVLGAQRADHKDQRWVFNRHSRDEARKAGRTPDGATPQKRRRKRGPCHGRRAALHAADDALATAPAEARGTRRRGACTFLASSAGARRRPRAHGRGGRTGAGRQPRTASNEVVLERSGLRTPARSYELPRTTKSFRERVLRP